MEEAEARLRKLWEEIPEVGCRGMCVQACGPIAMSEVELEILSRHAFFTFPRMGQVMERQAGYHCPMLSKAGHCTAYADRPTICRLWGAEENMPCEWGCQPEGGRLPHSEGSRILGESMEIGGGAAL